MGRNVSGSSFLDQVGGISLIASSAISAGDLVSNNETGYATRSLAHFSMTPTQENNTVGGNNALKTVAPLVGATGSGVGNQSTMKGPFIAELGNGNIVHVYTGNGTTANTNLNAVIRSVNGNDIVSAAVIGVISTDTAIYCAVRKLNATQFVIAWNSNSTLKFAVLNNDGTIAVSATTVATLYGSGSAIYWAFNVTTSGQIVLAYSLVTSSDMVFKRYNAAGVLQGSETVVESGANSGSGINVLSCANGDFVISYKRSAATAAYKFARYNASGTIQGALTTILTASSDITYGAVIQSAIELAGGNIVFQTSNNTSAAYRQISIYNASNALVKTFDIGNDAGYGLSTSGYSEYLGMCANRNGSFAIASVNGGSVGIIVLSPDGFVIKPATNLDLGMTLLGNNPVSGILLFSLDNAGYAVVRGAYNNTGTQREIYQTCITPDLALLGSAVALFPAASAAATDVSAILTSANILVTSFYYPGNGIRAAYYQVCKRSITGVALNSVSAGGTVCLATKGTMPINQQNVIGAIFDNRAQAVIGVKATIVGSNIVMNGVV